MQLLNFLNICLFDNFLLFFKKKFCIFEERWLHLCIIYCKQPNFCCVCLLFLCIAIFQYFLTLKFLYQSFFVVADQNRHQDDVAPAEEGGEEDQGSHGGQEEESGEKAELL
jgi:hypothetical protein